VDEWLERSAAVAACDVSAAGMVQTNGPSTSLDASAASNSLSMNELRMNSPIRGLLSLQPPSGTPSVGERLISERDGRAYRPAVARS